MREQARAFVEHAKAAGLPAKVLLRDRDDKFVKHAFDAELAEAGIEVKPLSFRSPNLNAYVERFVQTIETECLDKFICFGREHLDYIAGEFVEYYHLERPHQVMGNETLARSVLGNDPLDGSPRASERLGGILRHYYRAAA
jgi:putative transposase